MARTAMIKNPSATGNVAARMAELWDSRHRELLGYQPLSDFSEGRALFLAYADELQRDGDPRGSLIALDMLPSAGDVEPMRRELLRRWLGEALASDPAVNSRCGLITVVLDDDRGPEVLRRINLSPGAEFIEAVRVVAHSRAIPLLLHTLCEREHDWLGRLFILLSGTARSRHGPVISNDLLLNVVRSMPKQDRAG